VSVLTRIEPELAEADPDVAGLVVDEIERQSSTICLIPSENYVSRAVLEAMGSVFTNKYSEGYAGRRYYEGQQVVDRLEPLAVERAKRLFRVEHANVQPYSGSPANLAIYLAFCAPGDTVMGMALPMGGHLTHGWGVSVTGKWFNAVQYGVRRETGRVDLDEVRELARRERPKLIFCGGTAIPRTIDFAAFAEIAREVNAVLVADIAHIAGLIAGGAHPSPVGHAEVLSTTTHKTLRGPRGAMLMATGEHASALDRAVFPGLQGGPHNHTTAAIAVALGEALEPEFFEYAQQVVENAKALAAALLERGFDLVSGGTDNHLLLVDLTSKGVTGKLAAQGLDRARITLNYNTVPFDPRKPFDPSGIRLGTPAVTTRGMGPSEMEMIARWINDGVAAGGRGDETTLQRIAGEVRELAAAFPIPGTRVGGGGGATATAPLLLLRALHVFHDHRRDFTEVLGRTELNVLRPGLVTDADVTGWEVKVVARFERLVMIRDSKRQPPFGDVTPMRTLTAVVRRSFEEWSLIDVLAKGHEVDRVAAKLLAPIHDRAVVTTLGRTSFRSLRHARLLARR
jgi:glycine hydroxymethyltransferase